jgi:hypothetical protein
MLTFALYQFNVIVDTGRLFCFPSPISRLTFNPGSSDTWVPGKGFQCTNGISQPEPQYACNFGPGQYDPTKSKTFKSFPYQTLNTTYVLTSHGPRGKLTVS